MVLDKWKVIYVITPKLMGTSMLWMMAGLQTEDPARCLVAASPSVRPASGATPAAAPCEVVAMPAGGRTQFVEEATKGATRASLTSQRGLLTPGFLTCSCQESLDTGEAGVADRAAYRCKEEERPP
jgi:hypothetical protein